MLQVSLLEFVDKMSQIMPEIAKGFSRRQAAELYKGKITLPQLLISDFLQRQGECKMTDLAHFMGVSTAAMTGIVDRLVRARFALRTFDPKDRRITKIRLTTKGEELVKKNNQQRRQMLISVFGRISEFDRREYLRILLQIKDIFASNGEAL